MKLMAADSVFLHFIRLRVSPFSNLCAKFCAIISPIFIICLLIGSKCRLLSVKPIKSSLASVTGQLQLVSLPLELGHVICKLSDMWHLCWSCFFQTLDHSQITQNEKFLYQKIFVRWTVFVTATDNVSSCKLWMLPVTGPGWRSTDSRWPELVVIGLERLSTVTLLPGGVARAVATRCCLFLATNSTMKCFSCPATHLLDVITW